MFYLPWRTKPYYFVFSVLFIVSALFQYLLKLPVIGRSIQWTELVFVAAILAGLLFERKFSFWFKREDLPILSLFILFQLTSIVNYQQFHGHFWVGTCYSFTLFLVSKSYLQKLSLDQLHEVVGLGFFWGGVLLALVSLSGFVVLWLGIPNAFLFLYKNYPYLGTIYRLCGPCYSPNILLSVFYGCLFFSALSKPKTTKAHWTKWIGISLMLLACLLTYSKSFLVIVAWLIYWFAFKKVKSKLLFYIVFVLLSILLVSSSHFLIIKNDAGLLEKIKTERFFSNNKKAAIGNYAIYASTYRILYEKSMDVFTKNPLLGVGSGQFPAEFEKYKNAGLAPKHLPNYQPHSSYWGTLAENGLIGFLTIFSIIALITGYLFKNFQENDFLHILMIVLACFLIEAFTTDIFHFRHFWIFLSIVSVFQKKHSEQK
jgi:hypothetical protein